MREIQELTVEPRTGIGKGPAYQTRRKSRVPAIIYGGEEAPAPVSVDLQTLAWHLERGSFLTTLFRLDIAGKKTRVIPRAIQLDPVTDRPLHVDFMRLAEGATVRLAIPVRFQGQEVSPGLKRGGVLNIVRHSVELICPAENIPDYIEGDVSEMDIRDSLHISAIKLPEGVRPVEKRDFTIASLVAPTHVIEEARAAAAAAAAAELAPEAEAAEAATPAAGAAAPGAAPAAAPGAAPAAAKPEKK